MPLENLKKVREKYPDYADIPDQELAQKIVSKHPEYNDILGDVANGSALSNTTNSQPSVVDQVVGTPRPQAKTLPGVAAQLTETFTPPLSLQDAMVKKPLEVEEMGQQVKGAVRGVINESTKDSPALKTIGNVSLGLTPFAPSEFGPAMAGELAPAVVSTIIQKLPANIMGRFLGQKGAAAEKFFDSTGKTLGDMALDHDISSGDKASLYTRALKEVASLGNKARMEISKMLANGADLVVEKFPQLRAITEDLLKSEQVGKYGTDPEAVNLLRRVADSDVLDFKTANEFREYLGKEIGRRFGTAEATNPDFVQALRTVYADLRNVIGKASPGLDNALQEQYFWHNITGAIKQSVSKGYDALPGSEISFIARGIGAKSPKLASILKSVVDAVQSTSHASGPGIAAQGTLEAIQNQ